MIKFLKILLTGIATSLFLFPFSIPGIPLNTKMALAVVGLFLFVFEKIRSQSSSINADFVWISIISFGVSAMAQLSVVLNHTTTTEYTDYFMSFWTWMGAAFAVTRFIKATHGELNVKLIGNYLIGVCVFQCITAYSAEISPWVRDVVDGILGTTWYATTGRLYGIGAFLDPAGLRFAAVLIITVACLTQSLDKAGATIIYLLSFFIISIGGSMISRTTTVGVVLGIGYFIVDTILHSQTRQIRSVSSFNVLLMSTVAVLLVLFVYNSNATFRKEFRFGFEGFFSYFEKGIFETNSTNILKSMYVLPEQSKTWVTGDGYLANPSSDPNYLGTISRGYYMGTDVGYLRFLFFFGLPGLLCMIAVFFKAMMTCIKIMPEDTLLFAFLFLSNMVCWMKVCSDIIMVFAPFLVLAYQRESESSLT